VRLLRQLAAVPALARHAPVRQQVHNLYYDTPDQALRRQRAALRIRRLGGGRAPQWLQTLKTADDGLSALSRRGEWEVPVPGPALQQAMLREAPPWQQLDPDGTLFAALQPCFSTDFERTRWVVRLRGGVSIEVALDQGAIVAGGRTAPLCELELELLSGPPGALFHLAAQIARRVPVLPLSASKAERGFALAQGVLDAPRHARPSVPPRRARAQALPALLLAEMFDQFTANLHALLSADHPELVHQARVGWRRFRSALRLLRPVLAVPPPAWPGLQPLLDLLGELRDLDVACTQTLPTLQPAYVAGDARRALTWAAVEQSFRAAATLQRKAVRLALQEPLTGQALLGITHWLEALGAAPQVPAVPARRWARERVARLRLRWKKARRDAVDAVGQHRARLLAKRLRYNIEALRPLLPERAGRWHERASRQQADAGALCDVVQAGVLALRLEAPSEVVAFLRGVAVGLQPPTVPDDGV
jgi:inorganic triphosphatase YgiF